MGLIPPTPSAGRYFVPGFYGAGVGGTETIADGGIVYYPFQVSRTVAVDEANIRVSTPGSTTSSITRIGIYDSGSDELPGELIAGTGDVDTTGIGADTTLTASLASTTLRVGRTFWVGIAYRTTGGTGVVTWRAKNADAVLHLGGATLTEASSSISLLRRIEVALGAWTELPDPADLTGAVFADTTPVAIALRVVDGGHGPGHNYLLIPIGDTVTNRWASLGRIWGGDNAATLVDGTIYYMPFYVTDSFSIDTVGTQVVAADAGATYRVGIYSDVDGEPGSLIVSTGDVDAGTTGLKSEAITSTNFAAETAFWVAIGVVGAPRLIGAIFSNTFRATNLGWPDADSALDGTLAAGALTETGYAGGALPASAAPSGFRNVDAPGVQAFIEPTV